MASQIKACQDCKHVHQTDKGIAFCHHPKSFKELPNYFTGKLGTVAHTVDEMRWLGKCEPEGKLFEPKR